LSRRLGSPERHQPPPAPQPPPRRSRVGFPIGFSHALRDDLPRNTEIDDRLTFEDVVTPSDFWKRIFHMLPRFAPLLMALLGALGGLSARGGPDWEEGRFSWKASGPLIDVEAQRAEEDQPTAIKDPTIVFHEGHWHLFATRRMQSGRVC